MLPDLSVGATYHLVVTLFQLSLALLIAFAGRLDDVRGGVATIIALSGGETLLLTLWQVGTIPLWGHPIYHSLFQSMDIAIITLLAVLLSRLPRALFPESSRTMRRMVLVTAATVPAVAHFIIRSQPQLGIDPTWSYYILHTVPFVAAAMFLLFHFLPGWLDLTPGPYRTMTMLAGAGLAMSPIYQGVRWIVIAYLEAASKPFLERPLSRQFSIVLLVTMGVLSLAALTWLLVRWVRKRSSDEGVLLLLLLVPVVLGARAPFHDATPLGEFASQAIRPVIFAVAILRYDLFQVPRGLRRIAVPGTLLISSTVVFLLLGILLSPEGIGTDAFSPEAATGAVLGVAALALLLQDPLGGMVVSAKRRESTSSERLERYRLALESLRARGDEPEQGEVESLRMRYGVSWEEHQALEAIMRRNVVVPTSAIHGLQPGDLVVDRYEVVRVLGEGGFGRAVLARDRRWGDRVVLKGVTRPWSEAAEDRRATLMREARAGMQVEDPRIAQVLDVVEEGRAIYLVREYVPGETLQEVVGAEGAFPVADGVAIVGEVLEALEALHDAGLHHLDIKPGNVILRPDGTPVIIDLGSATSSSDEDEPGATRALGGSREAGSLPWTAPERLQGEEVGPTADVFAVGALLHLLLTGRPHVATAGRVRYQVVDDIVRGSPPELPDHVPEDVAGVVRRALQRDPADRFPSVAAFRDALP